jgi:serine/threonine-protein kinase HipA
LRTYSSNAEEDLATFADAIAFNWLIAGTDAHAKNYSLLLGAGGQTRLAPLYDLASLLPYPQFNVHKTRLAMKLGGEYRLKYINRSSWQALAKEVRLPAEELIGRVRELARELASLAEETGNRVKQEGLKHKIIGRLKVGIAERAEAYKRLLSS